MTATSPIPASFLHRLGAIFYDALILLALLMLSTWILMPFTNGEAIEAGEIAYQLYLLVICCGYYLGFWLYGGQTVGMRAWRIRIRTLENTPLTLKIAGQRLLWAVLTLLPGGFGLWFALFRADRQTLYDMRAKTALYRC